MLRRTGFKRTPGPATTIETEEECADRKQAQARAAMNSVVPRASNTGLAPTPTAKSVAKFDYVRSRKLLEACREIPCQHCSASDGTVVAAHSNQSRHGKGRGIKASDQYVASLCYRCHCALDSSRVMTGSERVAMWDKAHASTVRALVRLGLWPADCPVPDIRRLN